MVVTDFIVKELAQRGVKQVFELSGGMIMQLIDAFYVDGSIELVAIHHEQAASFAADAQGRLQGTIPGVAIATSGPGATNLLTGIGSCYFDSSPAVFITGQVNRHEQKGDKQIRQLGFQETDIVGMATPITKKAIRVNHPNEVPSALNEAFELAIEGRPGPVLVDIPMDVFRGTISAEFLHSHAPYTQEPQVNLVSDCTQILTLLQAAERPLILAGGGIAAAVMQEPFQALVELLKIPVVHSLLAVDILPHRHPYNAGFIGTYGNRWSNISLSNADFILVLGSRLDIRQTGADVASFSKNKTIIHIDAVLGEMNNRVASNFVVHATLQQFIPQFTAVVKAQEATSRNYEFWLNSINDLRLQWPDYNEVVNKVGINPNIAMRMLSEHAENVLAYCVDVGQHQMWAAQSLILNHGERFLTSGGMGAMGFALPAALGAAFFNKHKAVVVVAGDAGFQLNLQELETIKRNNLNIKIVVVNNKCHGMTRQFQETYFKGRYRSTIVGYSAPNFTKIAEAYGIPGYLANNEEELKSIVETKLNKPGAVLIEIMVDTYTNAYPKLAFGLPISEMEPFAKPMEMEGT